MAPSIGLIFGSQQRMACRFQPSGPYPPEAYVGVMNTIGLDIGITAGGVMAWGVFAPTAGPMYGGLAGTYWGERFHRRWCRRRGQSLIRRNRTFDRASTPFGRRIGWDQSFAWSFGSHSRVGAMRTRVRDAWHGAHNSLLS
jgi:hypothetical protein